ncbi:enoyl-CoA hydratase/isomerase family protein [Nocardioides carbamazepini]|uniref:enoyl-CoA hydratase/isomerase family protein n=1 Tax=Nocardioides carbamazepini TaxID=2854259 RepID=UPI002149FD5F|nr:enoyl-CoA hydratase-related protein [Nocardioides carbamazepini]MCR1783683.1 enoyl-CoA hydratase/isomerase family protein [Nocardioides carbamazepini]
MTATATRAATDALGIEERDGVLELTLQRPDAMNALNLELKQALADVLRDIRYDESVRAVLLTGAGRAFCAGGDLSEMDPNRTPEQARVRQHQLLSDVFVPLARTPKPVVAAVNGHAHGAGLSLALACDVVVTSAEAPMSFGYVLRGLTPDCGITYVLPRLVGMARAKELLYTGRRFTGADAERMGLVAEAVPAGDEVDRARALAAELGSGATVALGLTKRMLDQSSQLSFEDLAEVEAYSQAITRATADHAEGILAFKEKRRAEFRGA